MINRKFHSRTMNIPPEVPDPSRAEAYSAFMNSFLLRCRSFSIDQFNWNESHLVPNNIIHKDQSLAHGCCTAIARAFNQNTHMDPKAAIELASYVLQGADLPILNAALVTKARELGEI